MQRRKMANRIERAKYIVAVEILPVFGSPPTGSEVK